MFDRISEFREFCKYVEYRRLWLIPLAKNSKRPLKGFKFTEQKINKSKAQDYLAKGYNVGIVAKPDKLCFIDVDNPSLIEKYRLNKLNTLVVKTPKGYHYYFYNCGLRCNFLGNGIELRCYNMYVVAPGSVVDGKMYRVINHAKPLPITEVIKNAKEKL